MRLYFKTRKGKLIKILITGAAGFIGSYFAIQAHNQGHEVLLVDNFNRPRSKSTAQALNRNNGLEIINLDIRNLHEMRDLFEKHPEIEVVWHLAGQVSYLESLRDPIYDFCTNANGTQNLLECARSLSSLSAFIYSSSNKVYGDLSNVSMNALEKRYTPEIDTGGFDESLPVKPAGPYGVSKYTGELLCELYDKEFQVPCVVFRQSSIVGENQKSTDDQGWLAYFCEKFARNEEYYFTGNGMQVRDVLHVQDLFQLFCLASHNYRNFEVFNVGGGVANSLSILELPDHLKIISGNSPSFQNKELRSNDQKWFVSNNHKASQFYSWEPKVDKLSAINLIMETYVN